MAKTIELNSNKKSLKKRIILFVIFFVVGVVGITLGVSSCVNNMQIKPGLELIEPNQVVLPDKTTKTPFDNQIALHYYVKNTKKQTATDQYNGVTRAYNQIAYTTYLTHNANYEFKDYISLAYINNHPNTEIQVSSFLFNSLKDAYNKTISDNSKYNVFAGRIYDFWDGLFYSNTKNPDPANSTVSYQNLTQIVNAIKYDQSKYSLTFNEQKQTVTYNLNLEDSSLFYKDKDEVKCLLKLDFNVLYEAYAIETMANYLLEHNFTTGFFTSSYGYYLHLKDYWLNDTYATVSTNIYSIKENRNYNIASFTIDGAIKGITYSNYYFSANDKTKYQITVEGTTYRRHKFFDASNGLPNSFVRYSKIYTNDSNKKLYDIGYENLYLINAKTKLEADNFIKNRVSNSKVMYVLDNGKYDDSLDELFKLYYYNIDNLKTNEQFVDRVYQIND